MVVTTNCIRCNRPLRNPASVQNGMGPVCASKDAAKRRLENQPAGILSAQFAVMQVTAECVWIVDTGRECRSVTNDAEAVVASLAEQYGERRIIYRDTDGNWDELKHRGAVFTGFAPARDMAPDTWRAA
jgi:hypothetical protein